MPQHHVNHTIDLSEKDFGGTGKYTWEAWNCAMAYQIFDNPGEKVVMQHQAWLSCQLQSAARYAMMGLLAVVTLRLALGVIMLWRDKRSARRGPEGGDEEIVVAKTSNLEESTRSSVGRQSEGSESIKEAQAASLYEMPAYRMSRVEMDDAAYREMEGDGGGRELAGHEVAVEAPATERRRDSMVKEG